MHREHWGSRIGFILATAGAAVGLGNIQRFPYIVAHYGGAAFCLVYLFCVFALGFPLMLVEFAVGRHGDGNPVAAIQKISPKGRWNWIGLLGILTAYFIFTYYLVAAGWTLGYMAQMFAGEPIPLEEYASNPQWVFGGSFAMLLVVMSIVLAGVKNGIERCGKILMPILLCLLLGLVARSVTLPGSWEGVVFYLKPDFSHLDGEAFLFALSQAFFSLCVGEAVLVTYGSYAKKTDNMVSSALSIACFDTMIALLAGLVIFPAVFSFGQDPDQGVGLIFNVMPHVFLMMPYGHILGSFFFMILAFAALTTCIALLEIPVTYMVEQWNWSRVKAVIVLSSLAYLFSIPSALSKGMNPFLSEISLFSQKGFYELMDFAWGSLSMVIGGLFLSVFVAYVWGADKAVEELSQGCPGFRRWGNIWMIIIKYVAPIAIVVILLNLFC